MMKMDLKTCVIAECRYRWGNFLLTLLVTAFLLAFALGAHAVLQGFDHTTRQELANKESEACAEMARLEDEMRKITKRLGFNILILPAEQNLAEFYADDYAAKTMPEDYVDRLAGSGIITVQHLLPTLQRKILWREQQRTILLTGVRAETPITGADVKSPILDPAPEGTIILGYELHAAAGLQPGQAVEVLGRRFTIHETLEARGTKDDITAWIPLRAAQELFALEGRINSIMALQCKCAWADLPKVRQEIGEILPETQVLEISGKALARAEARRQAAESAEAVVAQWQRNREETRQRLEGTLAGASSGLALLTILAVGGLTQLNMRARSQEVAIFRSLGVPSGRLVRVLLTRAVLTGLAGAVAGIFLVIGFTLLWNAVRTDLVLEYHPLTALIALVLGPCIAIISAWLPVQSALKIDPALILARDV